MRQLGFPWYREQLTTTTEMLLSGDTSVRVVVRQGREELVLALAAEEEHCTVHVRVGYPTFCMINGFPGTWDMRSGGVDGVFEDALDWALEKLDAEPLMEARCDALRSVVARVTKSAVAMAEPSAHLLASRLTGEARMFVYGALLDDDTGRVEQMIDACPALLVLAASHRWDEVISRIRTGDRLRDLVKHACKLARLDQPHAAASIRRSSGIVPADVLLDAIAAPGVDLNDMPSSTSEQPQWFEALAQWRRCARRIHRGLRCQFGAFMSARGTDVHRVALRGGDGIAVWLRQLQDWMIATLSPAPTRRSEPERLNDAINNWHQGLWARSIHEPNTPLVPGPRSNVEVEGIRAEPILTSGELHREGLEMRHCVGSMATQGARGERFFYRATIAGRRATIAIARGRGGEWRLVEAAGPANAGVGRADLIARWVASLEAGR